MFCYINYVYVYVYVCVCVGFEKMEHGLSEKFTDKTSPIKNHTDTLVDLGADPKPISHMNTVTSDVIKVMFMNMHI